MRHPEFISGSYQPDASPRIGKMLKQVQHDSKARRKAFTLAEVLITLVVIGVVAAITIPILRQSTGDKKYDAARKVALMTIGQAGRQIAANGEMNQAAGTTAEQFVKNHFSKYVKIAKECGTDLEECGLSEKIKKQNGDEVSMPVSYNFTTPVSSISVISSGYAFKLTNGFSVNLFYNPLCQNGEAETRRHSVCINAIYDMNGLKGPNEFGKDIGFVTVIHPDIHSVAVAPHPYEKGPFETKFAYQEAMDACPAENKNLILPNRYELYSMIFNDKFLGDWIDDEWAIYWSSTYTTSVVHDMKLAPPSVWTAILMYQDSGPTNLLDDPLYAYCIYK